MQSLAARIDIGHSELEKIQLESLLPDIKPQETVTRQTSEKVDEYETPVKVFTQQSDSMCGGGDTMMSLKFIH